jgi:UDP-N-acetylglucosamine 3-dehydrogenase
MPYLAERTRAQMRQLRIGLVGCGLFGESHLAALRGIPYATVVALTDLDEERARSLAARFNVPRVAKDFRELCSLDEVEAVSVVTTEDQHLSPVLAAFANGKHVFVEKPRATTVEDAQGMVDASRETGLILMPGHVCRFETKYATVKEQLTAGRLGQVVSMTARQNRPKGLAPKYKRTHQALVCCIHEIDIMQWYAQAKVTRVRAYEARLDHVAGPDLTWGILEFAGGALGFVQTMWLLPDKANVQDDGMQVVGTSGVANITIHSGLSLWLQDGQEVPEVSYEPRVRGTIFGALREELSYFVLCVIQKCEPTVVTPQEGVDAVRTAVALIESGRTGKDVTIA